MTQTAPQSDIRIGPIERTDLESVPLRCWPDRETIEQLFDLQGTIGMAAWDGRDCVGQLHCYRVSLPDVHPSCRPECKDWWSEAAPQAGLPLRGPAWCLTCFHVGRTQDTFAREDSVSEQAKGILKGTDSRYHGRGIGGGLCKAAVQWAREHNYMAMLAPGAPVGMFTFATWAGHLPRSTYERLGFRAADTICEDDILPNWARGDSPPEVMAEVRKARADGRRRVEFHERLMVLDMGNAEQADGQAAARPAAVPPRHPRR